jgi:hypothetical protein
MTVYFLTYADRYTDFATIGVFSSEDKAKMQAESHWQKKNNTHSLRWYTSVGGETTAVPAFGDGEFMAQSLGYVNYSIKAYEVDK